jgi:hypothetical protein
MGCRPRLNLEGGEPSAYHAEISGKIPIVFAFNRVLGVSQIIG